MRKHFSILLCSLCVVFIGGYYLVNHNFYKKQDNLLLDPNFYNDIDFSKIKDEDFEPAINQAIKEARSKIQAIIDNKEEPSFLNTIVALDQSSFLLERVSEIFEHLVYVVPNPDLKAVEKNIGAKIVAFSDEMYHNKELFKKIKYVYDHKDRFNLDKIDLRLLETVYNSFIKEGVNLDEESQKELEIINQDLTKNSTQFANNIDKQAGTFEKIIPFLNDKGVDSLDGVPEDTKNSFKKEGKEGYVLSYLNPKLKDIIKYAKDRSLRKQVYEMDMDKGKELNSDIIVKIINSRLKKAKLLGFKNHAEYVLKNSSMADTPEKALELINEILPKSLDAMKKDKKVFEEYARKFEKDPKFELKMWDWSYYAEKIREEKYAYNSEELKPYFELSKVRDGVFTALNKLYGVNFKEKEGASIYYKDDSSRIDVFDVTDKDGSYLGILYLDYFARNGKRPGAWSTSIKSKYAKLNEEGKVVGFVPPVEAVVFNFSSNLTDGNVLLNLSDVETLFHEMGHAINMLFREPKYRGLAESYRDFVELPSQIFENWAFDESYLSQYAKHYKTGETIPVEYVKKIKDSETFNNGMFVTRQLFLGLEDLGWHMIEEEWKGTEAEFEDALFKSKGLPVEFDIVSRAYQFPHMVTFQYDAKYYSYMWSDRLVADAFSVFKEKGIFNQEVATSFRKNILTIGNTVDPNESYREFRGKDPEIKPLLKKFGFIK